MSYRKTALAAPFGFFMKRTPFWSDIAARIYSKKNL